LVQHLPDCMALEMVSPPQKAGQPARFPNLSLDGSRVSFFSQAALGENPPSISALRGSIYVASRGENGWTTARTLPLVPLQSVWETAQVVEAGASLTPDFSRSLIVGATAAQSEQGIAQAYDTGLGGSYSLLSTPLEPLAPSETFGDKRFIVSTAEFQAASADHSHLFFQPGQADSTTTTYLPGDPSLRGPGAEDKNTYLVGVGADGQPLPKPELLQRAASGKVWGGECGARLGGIGTANRVDPAPNGPRNQGAVAADGRLTYLSVRESQPPSGECEAQNKLRILQRHETPSGPQISPLFSSSECGRVSPPCSIADGDDLYQGASLDQSKVYFTTNRQLASTDTDGSSEECDLHTEDVPVAVPGCDLYLYDRHRPAGERLIQVSAGEDVAGQHEHGSEADLYNGITAISADGSRAYFVATGVLTNDANPENETAAEGAPNLYLFDLRAWEAAGEAGGLSFVGTLDPSDGIELSQGETSNGLWGGKGTWQNDAYPVPVLSPAERRGEGDGEEGGDGHLLVFEAHASFTPEDADGGHLDVYRYNSEAGVESLQCVSCAPGSSASQPDEAPFDVAQRSFDLPLETDFAERGRWVSEDGQEIVFRTAQGLRPGDVNGATDDYLWQDGQLYRLTQGGIPRLTSVEGAPVLSPDGASVAFGTGDPLLPQDGDTAEDIYAARAGGGFPPPPPPETCQGEECRGEPSEVPGLTGAGTAVLQGAGNLEQKPCKKPKVRRHGRCVRKHHKRHRQHRHHIRDLHSDRRASR
jgi:hypothetical protein